MLLVAGDFDFVIFIFNDFTFLKTLKENNLVHKFILELLQSIHCTMSTLTPH